MKALLGVCALVAVVSCRSQSAAEVGQELKGLHGDCTSDGRCSAGQVCFEWHTGLRPSLMRTCEIRCGSAADGGQDCPQGLKCSGVGSHFPNNVCE
jgi:hypothetical protein